MFDMTIDQNRRMPSVFEENNLTSGTHNRPVRRLMKQKGGGGGGANFRNFTKWIANLKKSDLEIKIRGINTVFGEKLHDF